MPIGEWSNENKTNKYVEMKEKNERRDMQSWIEVDKEDLYTLKINCKGKRTPRKANKGINVEKCSKCSNRLKKL